MSPIHPSHQFLALSLVSIQPGAPCANYQSNTCSHRCRVLQEAVNAESTRNVGGKAMKKEADRMKEELTGLVVHKAFSESSDRP